LDTNQYLDLFLDESREHLQNINSTLLQLEQLPDNIELVQSIFRSAHTLKGMSATMGYTNMATLTHRMENVLDAVRNHQIHVTEAVVDLFFEGLDGLSQMVDQIANGRDDSYDIQSLTEQLDRLLSGAFSESKPADVPVKNQPAVENKLQASYDPYVYEVLKESINQGFDVFQLEVTVEEECQLKGVRAYMVFQALGELGEIVASTPTSEELEQGNFDQSFLVTVVTQTSGETIQSVIESISEIASVKVETMPLESGSNGETATGSQEAENEKKSAPIPEQNGSKPVASGTKTLRVNLDRLDALMNLFEELIIERGRLEGLSKKLKDSQLNESVERLVRTSGHLRDVILNLRMVPVETVFNRFPRMVRSVAKDLNKQINLIVTGQETELDRTVIDEIGDPLVHLLRNSMDHGIESPEVRRSMHKTEEGSIHLRAFHQGNHVYIEIEDDGSGINRDNVVKKAIENGLITEEEAVKMGDQEVYSLIFRSGFSTAEKISDLSGRGVGLDVVKSKIEALGGHVEVTSTPGKGSLFSIQLPLTLSIISAMLVEVGQETYAMPLSSILETQRIDEDEILPMHQMEVMTYRDRVIPLVRLQKALDTPVTDEQSSKIPVLIIKQGAQLVGLTVDRLIGQQEIVVKPLSAYLRDLPGYSGATILGDGNVSLILDPSIYVTAD
jgi:two-component system, chemotaxis family, sensor kinase CheA